MSNTRFFLLVSIFWFIAIPPAGLLAALIFAPSSF
jgi:hypothetical protein